MYQILSDMLHRRGRVMQHTAATSGLCPLSTRTVSAFHCSKSSALRLILPSYTSWKKNCSVSFSYNLA